MAINKDKNINSLICNQKVEGSTPSVGTSYSKDYNEAYLFSFRLTLRHVTNMSPRFFNQGSFPVIFHQKKNRRAISSTSGSWGHQASELGSQKGERALLVVTHLHPTHGTSGAF